MPERTITITLTQTECQRIADVCDMACRGGGMQTARTAVWFVQKLEGELTKPEPEPNIIKDIIEPKP